MKLNKDLNLGVSEFLCNYLRGHSLTQSKLSDQLGYKSVTSVVRLVKGRVAYSAVEDCLKRFANMPMTPEEQKEYKRLTETDISLLKHFEWLDILNSTQIDYTERIMLEPGRVSLQEHFKEAQNLELRIFGCITPKMTAELLVLLNQNTNIEHFIQIDDQGRSISGIMSVVLPLFYSKNYYSTLYDTGKNELISGLSGSDCILCSYTDAKGDPHAELITLISHDSAVLLRLDPSTDIDAMYTLIRKDRKTNAFSVDHRSEYGTDMVSYFRYCVQLENNVPIRRIKPDIGFESIPVEILRSSLKTELFPMNSHGALTISRLEELARKRWRFTLLNTQPRKAVLKKSAMEKFFKTGLLSDHPYLLRALNPSERRLVLDSLIRMQTSNSNNYIYFLKDDDLLCDREATLYGRSGLCLIRPHTDYALQHQHAEAMICRKHVMDSFSAFFDEALIGKCTLSREESAEVLRSFYSLLGD